MTTGTHHLLPLAATALSVALLVAGCNGNHDAAPAATAPLCTPSGRGRNAHAKAPSAARMQIFVNFFMLPTQAATRGPHLNCRQP